MPPGTPDWVHDLPHQPMGPHCHNIIVTTITENDTAPKKTHSTRPMF